jgi:hypothetical protein
LCEPDGTINSEGSCENANSGRLEIEMQIRFRFNFLGCREINDEEIKFRSGPQLAWCWLSLERRRVRLSLRDKHFYLIAPS